MSYLQDPLLCAVHHLSQKWYLGDSEFRSQKKGFRERYVEVEFAVARRFIKWCLGEVQSPEREHCRCHGEHFQRLSYESISARQGSG